VQSPEKQEGVKNDIIGCFMQCTLCSFTLLAHLFHPVVLLNNQYTLQSDAFNTP